MIRYRVSITRTWCSIIANQVIDILNNLFYGDGETP